MRTIALEEHFVTKDYLRVTGAEKSNLPVGTAPFRDKLLDTGEERLSSMHANGISLQVLSLAALGFDALDAATATALAHDVNDELASRIAQAPEHLAGFAILGLKDPETAASELERAVQKLALKGAMFSGTVGGTFLDQPRFLPVWEAAAALGVPIYLHPAPPPPAVKQAYYSGMPGPDGELLGELLSIAGWGWHTETGLYALRVIVSGLFDRLPTLQLILGHMGEGIPYALARSGGMLSHVAKHLERSVTDTFLQQVHVTTSGYFTRPSFDCAEEVLGIDRLLFSIDYPFSSNEEGRAFLDALNPMNNDRRAKLTHANAERLLKL